jgi:hypothetical protein
MPQALAAAHKQRLHFAFRLSRQHYASAEGAARAAQLAPALRSPILERWARALHDMTFPAQRWQAWHAALERLLEAGNKARRAPCSISSHQRSEIQGCLACSLSSPDPGCTRLMLGLPRSSSCLFCAHGPCWCWSANGNSLAVSRECMHVLCLQEEARGLFRQQVWPDLVANHWPSRAARKAPGALPLNALASEAAEKLLGAAFGPDGAKLELRTLVASSEKIRAGLAARTEDYRGRRDLSRLSPWLAKYAGSAGACTPKP